MIDYSIYDLPNNIKQELLVLEIDFVFQPIFDRDGNIYAYEALMRPKGETVTDLIDRYAAQNKLHILELATTLGAIQEYVNRGYSEHVHINSFPSEYLSDEECQLFARFYPDLKDRVVIEVVEYLKGFEPKWKEKKPLLEKYDMPTAIDDFGTGENTQNSVLFYRPNIIKFDRSLICDIQNNPDKLKYAKEMVLKFHEEEYYLVAEGIETAEEYAVLKQIGFDFFQGFYLGMPQ